MIVVHNKNMVAKSGEIDDFSPGEILDIQYGIDARELSMADAELLLSYIESARNNDVLRDMLDNKELTLHVHGGKIICQTHFALYRTNIAHAFESIGLRNIMFEKIDALHG